MTSKQLAVFYTVFLTVMLTLVLGTSHYLDGGPMTALEHANKLCQEVHGPQTQAQWSGETLVCETVRGEIIPLRRQDIFTEK